MPTIQKHLFEKPAKIIDVRGAQFSPCRTWRYVLHRRWSKDESNYLGVFGLNPSKADEWSNDRTVNRCIRFAKDWGFCGLIMMNTYGFCATDPLDMIAAVDPVGPGNDETIMKFLSRCSMKLAAWGSLNKCHRVRVQWYTRIKAIQDLVNGPMHCLGLTKDGSPRHPLYVPASQKPELFWEPAA